MGLLVVLEGFNSKNELIHRRRWIIILDKIFIDIKLIFR